MYSGFNTRSDTNVVVQPQKMVKGLMVSDLGKRWIVQPKALVMEAFLY